MILDQIHKARLLTCEQMAEADAFTIEQGTSGILLMERAGKAVANIAEMYWRENCSGGVVLILCGPGNNGGDGYVAARFLQERDIPVRVLSFGSVKSNKDSSRARKAFNGPIGQLESKLSSSALLDNVSLVVDSLFGAGLDQELTGTALEALLEIDQNQLPVIAVDVPSGLDGDTGMPRNFCLTACHTVTFASKKPGHLLYPGRKFCGEVHVIDIGVSITDEMLKGNAIKKGKNCPEYFENLPDLWRKHLPIINEEDHKYIRGHIAVLGGVIPTLGASRLAAIAALRAGCGLVTLLAAEETYKVQAAALNDVLVKPFNNSRDLLGYVDKKKFKAVIIGPGSGLGDLDLKFLRELIIEMLDREIPLVMDADAITAFESNKEILFNRLHKQVVLTPHAGEFKRLFPGGEGFDKLALTLNAAAKAGCIVVHKGADTVIASPDGRACINTNAGPQLSVGGTGDVLAGVVGGFLGRGMGAFEAACAAVWVQGDAADSYPVGMLASDLLTSIPNSIEGLYKKSFIYK